MTELKKFYNAETGQVNFKNTREAANLINDFISESTNGKIENFVEPDGLKGEPTSFFLLLLISLSDVDSMLINAVFFQGDWRERFPQPFESNFSTSEGQNRLVPMMAELRDYYYNKDDDFQVRR